MKAHAPRRCQPQAEKRDAADIINRRAPRNPAAPRHSPAETTETEPAAAASAHFAHDFSKVPVSHTTPVRIQPKLVLSTPGDESEQEADRVARKVLSTPRRQSLTNDRAGREPEGHEAVRASREPSRPPSAHVEAGESVETSVLRDAINSPGRPLDGETRGFMESRFGHDFSRVRVHTDPPAARSAQALAARAYTFGSDVVFAPGRYSPASGEGRLLLAHELAHVAQQSASNAPAAVVRRQPAPTPTPAPTPAPKPAPPPKPKSLGELKISAKDPLATGRMLPLIDEVFKRNPTVKPYIGNRLLEQGREIAAPGKVTVHTTPANFKDAFEKYTGKPATPPRGFYSPYDTSSKSPTFPDEIHLPPDATFGEAFHEAVHKMSDMLFVSYLHEEDQGLAFTLNEGLTSVYSILILKDEGINDYTDGYAHQRAAARKLIDEVGADAVAKWYWQGDRLEMLKKLGVQRKSKNEKKDVVRLLKKIISS